MLTLANFNTTQAKTYYKRENYYSQEEDIANSEWRGHGASKYKLSGPIDDLDAYENIVNGHSPDSKTQLRQKQSHKDKKERAGVDLTFSAPKSVSLACLVGGDSRLEEAHRIATRRTIDLIEERYAFTRSNGERVKTGNLIVAMWHHDTSRELDPHLHSHCLLMNCTQSPDGRWRSLSNEEFFRNKILLGQIYRNELALECRKLGYEIEPHPKELFEIKGYTREQIEAFSKRHEQIKEKLAEIGVEETTENKIWAWRKTRVKKNHEIERQEMLPYWHSEADLYGINHPLPEQNFQLATTQKEVEAELSAAVQAGIEHCSERKVAFKSEDIEKFVTAQTRPFGISELQSAISSHPELIKTFDGRYTTQKALARELDTIKLMQQGKRMFNPITHIEAVEHYLDNKTLTQGQREAVTVAATTADQFIAWQGVAGAGKTYALKELGQITQELKGLAQGYNIKGFAPSSEAAKVLEEELGIEANTVASLLVSKQPEAIQPNQIWIVDEAGLLSAKAAYELLQRATDERARVILVGDTRQMSAVEAGNPFKSLQSSGIQTAHLHESLRQKAPLLQKAVNLAFSGQITEAIAHLEQVNRVEEIPDAEERTTKIATEYIKLPKEERQNTLILAGTHKERSAIVNSIRAALKEEGTLGYGIEASLLRAKQELTSIQTRYTHNYSVGDVVVPIRQYRRSGLHKSQPYTVKAIAKDKLTLSDLAGNHLTVDPMKFRKTVYKQEAIELAVGDRLKWTCNDKELGRRNGQEFTVTGIERQTATIEFLDGKTNVIDLSQPLHLDYALVSTTYSSQGKTAARVLISSTVDLTVSQESFYVAISRAKHDLQIFAENRELLFEQAQQSNAQETALSLLPESRRVESRLQPQAKSDFDPRQSKPEPRAEGATGITRAVERQNTASHGSITRQDSDQQRTTRQLISALADFLEVEIVESSSLANVLQTLTESLSRSQYRSSVGLMQELEAVITNYLKQPEELQQRTLDAIVEFVEYSSIEEALTKTVESFTQQFNEHQQSITSDSTALSRLAFPLGTEQTQEQALQAITDYVQQQAIETSAMNQELEALTSKQFQLQKLETSPTVDQADAAAITSLAQDDDQRIIHQCLEALANYIEARTIESNSIVQNLEILIPQLLQNRSQKNLEVMQELETVSIDELTQIEITTFEPETLEHQTKQAVEALANHLDFTTTEALLNQPLPTEGKELTRPQEVDKEQIINRSIDASALHIEQETVESDEVVSALENLAAHLRTFQKGESLLAVNPDSHISNQALNSITSFIEQTAVDLEITECLEDLTKELMPPQPQITNWVEQLGTAISHLLQQMKAVSALKQQEVCAHAVEAIVNYVEESTVERVLNPQALQTLTNQLSQLGNLELNSAMQQLEVTLACYQVPDSSLILAEKAVRDYFAAEPPQPPFLTEQQAIQLEIDRLVSQIHRLWSKQSEQVKLVESMQKNPFHLWNKKYDAQVQQLETTMQAISQSIAQKDQKQNQQQQWSKQSKAHQEWETSPQTQAMQQLTTFLNLPQVQSRLRALKQEQEQHVASKQIQREARETAQAVKNMFILTDTKKQTDGSLVLDGKNWRILQLGNTVSVTVKADNREILRVEGNKTTVFNPTPFERQKMHSFREEVQRDLQKRQQHRESERKRSQQLSL